jgi:hypothetical protein
MLQKTQVIKCLDLGQKTISKLNVLVAVMIARFSWYNIPKTGKNIPNYVPQAKPNGHKNIKWP